MNTYPIQHGSTPDLRVSNENKYYLVRETWQGTRMVNITILASFDTQEEAAQERERRKNAAAMMGATKSERKAATSRENGKRGGRPRKVAE